MIHYLELLERDGGETMDTDIDLSRLDGVTLTSGQHTTRESGMCVMEAVAWLASEEHTDFPGCVPREISRLAQLVNDEDIWGSDADRTDALRPLIPLMLRAVHGDDARRRRGYIAAHYAMQWAADALDVHGHTEHAAALRAFAAPTSRDECLEMRSAADAAYAANAAYAAYAAAADAAYAADAAAAADAADARKHARRDALLHLLRAFCEVGR